MPHRLGSRQKAWLTSANRTLDERLEIVDRCAPGGGWTRQERFTQTLEFARDGTLAQTFGLRTSMSDCTAPRCIANAIHGDDKTVPTNGVAGVWHWRWSNVLTENIHVWPPAVEP